MCTGYWETYRCNDCEKAKELYQDLDHYWDNKEERERVEKELEKMGYSV